MEYEALYVTAYLPSIFPGHHASATVLSLGAPGSPILRSPQVLELSRQVLVLLVELPLSQLTLLPHFHFSFFQTELKHHLPQRSFPMSPRRRALPSCSQAASVLGLQVGDPGVVHCSSTSMSLDLQERSGLYCRTPWLLHECCGGNASP